MGDVAHRSISRETNYFHDFVQYPKQKFFAFPQPRYVLSMFLNFWHFSASCSCKNKLLKKCTLKNEDIQFRTFSFFLERNFFSNMSSSINSNNSYILEYLKCTSILFCVCWYTVNVHQIKSSGVYCECSSNQIQ